MPENNGDTSRQAPAPAGGADEILDLMHQAFEGLSGAEAAGVALEAVIFCARERRVAPEWAAWAVALAHDAYHGFEVKSYGEAFAYPDHTHVAAKRKDRRRAAIAYQVQSVRDAAKAAGRKMPKDEAIEVVARKLGRGYSESTVRTLVEKWEAECRVSGKDPYEVGRTMDARKLIFDLLAANLRPQVKPK